MSERQLPPLGVALVGSNAISVVAELVAATQGYEDFVAIRRRGNSTNLPVIMDSDAWNDEILRRPGYFKAHEKIQELDDLITKLVGGRRFDCFIHISKDIFCQMLESHPLCDRYFYLEEGITSMLGKRFGKARTRKLQPFIWKWRSRLFYRNRFNIFHPHFVTDSPKYGGSFAISEAAFPGFPNRKLLSLEDLPSGEALQQDVVVFLDAHYYNKDIEEEYKQALKECLGSLIDKPSTVAVKFHPRDTDPVRHE
ncbi:MAG TPA: hypothetical protein VM511_12715, partial [Luteolibacter sp.]|nr:hypothetical protein [Luteolibacter sp.]